jgi:lanosterol synthase
MFGQCMVEGSYVECTASCIEALAHLAARDPALARDVQPAIAGGTRFLLSRQRSDGSVPAAWGINFTYGAFHFVKGLRAAGVGRENPALARAARWLIAHQRADGGWGEHWSGCREARYVEHPESQPVMTAWALLALLDVVAVDDPVVRRGVRWLLTRQRPDGGWPPGAVNGVFFGSAMLDYRLYPSYFPAWALARYVARATSSP